jgi:hypothetical protein
MLWTFVKRVDFPCFVWLFNEESGRCLQWMNVLCSDSVRYIPSRPAPSPFAVSCMFIEFRSIFPFSARVFLIHFSFEWMQSVIASVWPRRSLSALRRHSCSWLTVCPLPLLIHGHVTLRRRVQCVLWISQQHLRWHKATTTRRLFSPFAFCSFAHRDSFSVCFARGWWRGHRFAWKSICCLLVHFWRFQFIPSILPLFCNVLCVHRAMFMPYAFLCVHSHQSNNQLLSLFAFVFDPEEVRVAFLIHPRAVTAHSPLCRVSVFRVFIVPALLWAAVLWMIQVHQMSDCT